MTAFEEAKDILRKDYLAVRQDQSVEEVINYLRDKKLSSHEVSYVYVLDNDGRLVGVVLLRDLISALPKEKIFSIMVKDVISVNADLDQEEIVKLVQDHDFIALPVVDNNRRLLGIVTEDDVLDIMEEETTEDFHKMASIGKLNLNLLEAGPLLMLQKRVPWLLVLVFMNIFSGAGIAYFEDTIEAVIALVFFLPLLIDSGGNSGSQAATLMVRSLAVGDVKISNWFKLLQKELVVAILLGIVMGIAVCLVGYFRAGTEVAVIVAMSMAVVVLAGSIIGMSLPFILTRFGFDPATASAPLVTSIADIAGVIIYFSIATWYLGI